uniref:Rad60/SUMO-like domain-containing protein n=1 Tax=Xiphophorus couchianus TaxID=32473 RepID=A0A3B5LWC8_9TELE
PTAEPETSEPSHLGQENRNLKVSESRGRVDQNHCASSPHQEAPLSYVFSQYLSRLPAGARRSVQFHFDGSKVAGSQTAAQLEKLSSFISDSTFLRTAGGVLAVR